MSHKINDHRNRNGDWRERHVDLMTVMFLIDLRQDQHDHKAQYRTDHALDRCDQFIAEQIVGIGVSTLTCVLQANRAYCRGLECCLARKVEVSLVSKRH